VKIEQNEIKTDAKNNSELIILSKLAATDAKEHLRTEEVPESGHHRMNSLSSNHSLLDKRLHYNQSHEPTLKNNYSFVSSNYDSEILKNKLMEAVEDENMANIKSNMSLNKTSLMLPPLTIGNMQKNFDHKTFDFGKINAFP
jgi:hypothetical protein